MGIVCPSSVAAIAMTSSTLLLVLLVISMLSPVDTWRETRTAIGSGNRIAAMVDFAPRRTY